MCRLYLACSSTAQPATVLISTLMPYTHRMSSRLRLFLEQYAQGVSGRAPVATYTPHPVIETWQLIPGLRSLLISVSLYCKVVFIAFCIKTKLKVDLYLYLMQLVHTIFCLHTAVALKKVSQIKWNSEILKELGLHVGADTDNKLPVRHSCVLLAFCD